VLTDQGLALLGAFCPDLEVLSLHNQEAATDRGVAHLLRLPLLQLDLSLCAAVTDASVTALALHVPSLRGLNLKSCWRVTLHSVALLLHRNPRIESLNLSCCSFVTGELFSGNTTNNPHEALQGAAAPTAPFLPDHNPSPPLGALGLRELHLSRIRRLTDAQLASAVRLSGFMLREVSLSKCDQLTNAAVVRLCLDCPIEALNCADCLHIDAGFVEMLAEQAGTTGNTRPLQHLAVLNVRHCRGWTDRTVKLLLSDAACGATALRKLYLGYTAPLAAGTNNTNPLTQTPAAAAQYDALAVAGLAVGVGARGEGLGDEALMLLASVLGRQLEILDLEGCERVTNRGVQMIARACSGLKKLVLSGIPTITDAAVRTMSRPSCMPLLTDLHLNYCSEITSQACYLLRRKRPGITKLMCHRVPHLRDAQAF
jgi:hypothetical protein